MIVKEIKFRAWHEAHKTMVNFYNDKLCKDEYQRNELCKLIRGDYGDVLMQFIGLQDINGKDIYEGDVLHQLDPIIWNPFTVEYCADSGCYLCGGTLSSRVIKHQELVVVGNIYENPNILKGELS